MGLLLYLSTSNIRQSTSWGEPLTIPQVSQTIEVLKNLCEICHEREATRICKICGRKTCNEHWGKEMCRICEATICESCGEKLSLGYCTVCGKLVCASCSKEIGAAVICLQCHSKLT